MRCGDGEWVAAASLLQKGRISLRRPVIFFDCVNTANIGCRIQAPGTSNSYPKYKNSVSILSFQKVGNAVFIMCKFTVCCCQMGSYLQNFEGVS